jgi:DNA-binding transcriptional ArsR family regulator
VSSVDERVFSAVGDPTRRQIVEWLATEGPAGASSLARRLPMSRQGVMKHLAVLREAGVVVPEPEGREVRYRLQAEPLAEATEWMAALAARWDERLALLRQLLRTR